ncbi:kinase-like protein [Pseudovirgaria hyperparasitica]|uniref:mitogen-activated protein kinase kinase n=1 Tax=Pseudovirgaria hyperparasitica TaxID=470096 RepID=A0A6A6VZW5_9PEZI|nr:kinase-like protein [Pseudovirgaria hyperparasitica]KAF2754867.1 kinase-like protein [Pseudovirgaria hyperparasitica]
MVLFGKPSTMFPLQPPPNTIISLIPTNDDAKSLLHHEHNRHLVSEVPQAKTDRKGCVRLGFNLSFALSTEARTTLVTIGKDKTRCQIFADGSSIGKVHCTIEIREGTTDVFIMKRTNKGSIGFFNNSPTPLNKQGLAPLGPETNTIFGIGHRKGDLYVFAVYWHRDLEWQALANRQHLLSQTRSTEIEMEPHEISQGEARRVLRIHTTRTPAGKLRMNYKTINELGSGTYGTVTKVQDVDSGNLYACKKVRLPDVHNDYTSFAKTKREVEIPFKFSHPHIIKYVFAQRMDQKGIAYFEIFTELKDGSIEDLIRNGEMFVKHKSLGIQVLLSMLRALEYIADQGFIHRDIKPANILYNKLHNGQFEFCLADFGLVNISSNARTIAGTPVFYAPEILMDAGALQTPKVDIWSLFVTYAFMINANGLRNKLTDRFEENIKAVREAVDNERCTDLEPMTRVYPAHRASARQMLQILNNGVGAAEGKTQTMERTRIAAPLAQSKALKRIEMVGPSNPPNPADRKEVKDRGMFVLQTRQPSQPMSSKGSSGLMSLDIPPSKLSQEKEKSKRFWGPPRRTSSGMSGIEYE